MSVCNVECTLYKFRIINSPIFKYELFNAIDDINNNIAGANCIINLVLSNSDFVFLDNQNIEELNLLLSLALEPLEE